MVLNCYEKWMKLHPFRDATGKVIDGGGDAELASHEKFIRKVAEVLKHKLEVDCNPESDSLSDLVEKINDELSSSEFSKDPAVQREVTHRLKELVSELTDEIVDDDLARVINSINEMVVDTAGGMAAAPIERFTVFPKLIDQANAFLTVANRNLQMQKAAVNSLTGPQKESAVMLASQAEELVRTVQSILDSLRGHLKGIKPKIDTLKDLVDSSKHGDFVTKLEKILKLDLSSSPEKAAEALAIAMKRLGFLPIIAKQVRDALKAINLSVHEFQASPTFNALIKKADDNLLSGDITEKVRAMDAISKAYAQGLHHSLKAELSSNKKGGARDAEGKLVPPSKYKKSLKVAKKIRDVTISLFDRTLRALLTEFDNQAHKFAEEMRLGKIKEGEPVEKFIDALSHLAQVIQTGEGTNLQLALIGWNATDSDIAIKKFFMNALQYAHTMAHEVSSPAVSAMAKTIEKVKVAIDRYSDALRKSDDARMPVSAAGGVSLGMLAAAPLAAGLAVKSYNEFTKKEGGADEDKVMKSADIEVSNVSSNLPEHDIESACQLPENIGNVGGAPLDIADYGGVATEYTEIAAGPPGGIYAGGCGCDGGSADGSWAGLVATSTTEAGVGPAGGVYAGGAATVGALTNGIYTLAQSIKELQYYYRIISVHKHMKEAGNVLAGNDADFKKVLGKALGARKNVINKDYENAMTWFSTNNVGADAAAKARRRGLRQYYTELHDVTISFYDTLEALEIYLKNFTDGILNHPEDVADILTMLNGTQVIVKWFDDKSAKNIAEAFSKFGADMAAGVDASQYEDVKLALTRAFDGVDTLKNVMNAFARIGEKFGKDKIQTNMSIGAMYKNLKNFLTISYIKLRPVTNLLVLGSGEPVLPATTPGVAGDGLAPLDVSSERALFADMIKAMAAKIFTVTGLYDMVNRPLDKGGNFYNVLLRSTVGGGAPKIHTDAVELYIRLPLLAEWYRSIFNFNGTASDPTISMIPDYGNIWKELQEIMYHTANYVSNGLYSDAQFQGIIAAINKVYDHYHNKHGKNACAAAIKGFVEDTNMRYGVMWQKDQQAYNTARGRLLSTQVSQNPRDRPDFEILPGEGDDAYSSPGPSSDYTNPVFLPSTSTGKEGEIDIFQSRGLIRSFRERIINAFTLNKPMEALKDVNFVDKIRQCREDLDRTSDQTERYHTMLRTLQDANRVGSGRLAVLLMFHEQIVFGAEVACTILGMIGDFITNVAEMDDAPPDTSNFFGIVPGAGLTVQQKFGQIYQLVDGFAHCNVQVRMDDEHLSVDFTELIECVKRLVGSIRDTLPKFHGKIDNATILRYDTDPASPTSLLNLERLIRKYIDQEISVDDDAAAYRDGKKVAGLPRACSRLDAIYNGLSGNTDIADLVETAGAATRTIISQLENTNLDGLIGMAGSGPFKRITLGSSDTDMNNNLDECSSIKRQFNALLLKYLDTFFDLSDNNIYVNLIKPIVSAMHSDVYDSLDKNKQLLHKTTAYVLNTMMTGTLNVQKPTTKAFITDNFSGVSDFMKETLRCNLPYYHTLFHRVHVNIITVRNMLTHKNVTFAGDKAELLKTIENIIKGCNAMRQAIESVMAELKDVSIAFETSSRFVSEYKGMYGKTPILPASTLSVWLKNGDSTDRSLLPIHPASVDPAFKLMFGVRDVLNSKDGCKASNFKYNGELLKAYNHIASTPTKILDSEYTKYLECVCGLAKYAIYTKYWTCTPDAVDVCELTFQSNNDINRVVELLESGQQQQQLTAMVANLNVGGRAAIGGPDNERHDAQIVNILDLNIMPINIHMLSAQVPLTEVYSYAWTFDHLVGSLTSSDFQNNRAVNYAAAPGAPAIPLRLESDISPNHSGEGATLASLLIAPYRAVPNEAYFRQVQRLVAGLGDLPLGRPRYLDQLWKTVLGNTGFGAYGAISNQGRSPAENLARAEGEITVPTQSPARDQPRVADAATRAGADWEQIAKFNTYLMRDQFFLCNLQRILRYQMRRDLFKSLGPVVSSHDAVSEHVTEIGSDRAVHDESDVLTSEYLVFNRS